MGYKQLLRHYIDMSGLSLREISRRCKDKEPPVSQAYISKLLNDETLPPPSDEVSKVLAEVTGGDPEELIMSGRMDKVPDSIKTEFAELKKVNEFIDRSISFLINSIYMQVHPNSEQVAAEFRLDRFEEFRTDNNMEITQDFLPGNKVVSKLTAEEKMRLFETLIVFSKDKDKVIQILNETFEKKSTTVDQLEVMADILAALRGTERRPKPEPAIRYIDTDGNEQISYYTSGTNGFTYRGNIIQITEEEAELLKQNLDTFRSLKQLTLKKADADN